MATGKVKWFDKKKGFGFIQPDEGGGDVFVHHQAIQAEGFRVLEEGQAVEYTLEQTAKGSRAIEVRPVST